LGENFEPKYGQSPFGQMYRKDAVYIFLMR
jgi:hypothetical protein